jgi:GNAT superfamily N-acetyltransferase
MEISQLKIRRVEQSDIDEMVRHRICYLVELTGTKKTHDRIKTEVEMKLHFQGKIAEGSIIALVATHNDVPVSYGALVIKQIPGDLDHSIYNEADILNMYTIPEARKKGISSLILSKLIDEARKMGISKLSLHTTKDGERIYRAAGFTEPLYTYLEMLI